MTSVFRKQCLQVCWIHSYCQISSKRLLAGKIKQSIGASHFYPSRCLFTTCNNTKRRFLLCCALPRTCLVLQDSTSKTTVYLVGCMHCSPNSARDIEQVLYSVPKPSALVLELCERRFYSLMHRKEHKRLSWKDKLLRFQKNNQSLLRATGELGPVLLATGLSAFYGLQASIGFRPGVEFISAVSVAKQINPTIDIVLGDSPIEDTLKELYENLSPTLLIPKLLQDIQQIQFADTMRYLQTISVLFEPLRLAEILIRLTPLLLLGWLVENGCKPILYAMDSVHLSSNILTTIGSSLLSFWLIAYSFRLSRVLIKKRDYVLAKSLLETCRKHPGENNIVIGVVGLLHLQGILKHWNKIQENRT